MAEAGRGDGLVGRIVLAFLAFLAGLGVGGSLLMDVSLLPVCWRLAQLAVEVEELLTWGLLWLSVWLLTLFEVCNEQEIELEHCENRQQIHSSRSNRCGRSSPPRAGI